MHMKKALGATKNMPLSYFGHQMRNEDLDLESLGWGQAERKSSGNALVDALRPMLN